MRQKRMFFLYGVLGIIILAVAFIRFSSHQTDLWHKDPELAAVSDKPNEYRLIGDEAVRFDMPAADLQRLVDDFAQNQPRTNRIAGALGDSIITYIERSALMGYPDYITVKVSPISRSQAKLVIRSRSRFGYSDLGINKKRVRRWVAAIQDLVVGR
jgi:uncharacterized protein (DUF1499 family)